MNLQELKTNLDELKLAMTDSTISDLSKEINGLVEAGGKKFRPGLLFLLGQVFGLNKAHAFLHPRQDIVSRTVEDAFYFQQSRPLQAMAG